MKKIKLISSTATIFIILFSVFDAYTQENIANKVWTNGDIEYTVNSKNNILYFYGINRHEGGWGFSVKTQSNGKMTISDMQDDKIVYSYPKEYTDGTIEYKQLNSQEILIIKDNNDKLIDIFTVGKLNDMLISSLVNYLAGSYTDSSGKNYVFDSNNTRVSGFGNIENYVINVKYYVPDFIISFGENTHYLITRERSENSVRMRFEPCIKNKENEWEPVKNAKSIVITKKTWTSYVTNTKTSGRYPFTSLKVLTRGELIVYTNSELDIMRNEIFARYGQKFKTARYRDYFNTQSWYKAQIDDATSELTEIEKLNLQQILAVQEYFRMAN